ncbi:MAG: hypothetical protein ACLGHL_01880 [Actinomycetota bacterium]
MRKILVALSASAVLSASLLTSAPTGASADVPRPKPTTSPGSGDGNGHGQGDEHRSQKPDKDDCPTDGDNGKGNDWRCDGGSKAVTKVGFGKRAITPVGPPPQEWAQFFTPQPVTGAWGEPYQDLDGDGCYDPGLKINVPPRLQGPREPHVDQPWNSTGDGQHAGAFSVRGVTIYGDPGSTGKWDGVWAGAGFGSDCTLGAKDDTWARAIVIERGDRAVAMVSLDVVGFFNVEVRRAREELKARYPDMPIDELVVASTHTHEGVDTMGYWGENIGIDGKFPAYNAFIRSQILDAIHEAWKNREEAQAKFAVTEHTVGIRDSRDPNVIDPDLQAAQFIRPDGSTIGTLVEWSNHPEAQGGDNQLVSSDFPHATRETLERDLGGTSIYFSGSVGGLMTPLRAEVPGYGTGISWERTYEIGRLVAVAAEQALAAAPVVDLDHLDFQRREIFMDADNTALKALNAAGVFDIPTFTGGESWGRPDEHEHREGAPTGPAGTQFLTEMVKVEVGPAVFLTVPGELFPELEIGGYGRPGCPAADTGRPYEPVIADQYQQTYRFVLGLGQDELGYIVPGYDFWLKRLPQNDPDGGGLIPLGALQAEDPCGEGHYEETVSASSVMAPWVTCVAAELAGRNPWASEAACSYENTHTNPHGTAD